MGGGSGRASPRLEDDENLWSDDSSFYGDVELKASYEQRAESFDPTFFWSHYEGSLEQTNTRAIISTSLGKTQEVNKSRDEGNTKQTPNATIKSGDKAVIDPEAMEIDEPNSVSTKPHNPYEGDDMAKQLNEPLSSFLNRLRPSTTTTESGPWIWIANPLASNRHIYSNTKLFIELGTDHLDQYMSRKRQLQEQNPTKAASTITRMLKFDRSYLEESIFAAAKKMGVTCGKWMLFPLPDHVDEIWAKVAKATVESQLGCAAKVATDDGGGKPERLICVYTADFSDGRDVKRVLLEMKRLGLVSGDAEGKAVYYKCDAYTCLNITSQNDYKLRASLCSSKDVFGNLDGKWGGS